MNKVALIGRLTRDVELRKTQSGTPIASFTLAVDNRRKDDDGADFIPCVAWKKAAELLDMYTGKGDRVGVTGRISTRSYEKDGKKVFVTEVVVDEFDLLSQRKDTGGNYFPTAASTPPAEFPELAEEDAQLPF